MKKNKPRENDDLNYEGFTDDKSIPAENTEDKIDKLFRMRELDESNPLERAEKFNMVKRHPVKPGWLEVRCYEIEDNDGNPRVLSVSKQDDGTFKHIELEPFMIVDPYMLYASNIAQCPMNVVPMLIDQAEQQVELRKDTFIKKKEKRGEFSWWWLVVIGLILIGVLPMAYGLFTMFTGGG